MNDRELLELAAKAADVKAGEGLDPLPPQRVLDQHPSLWALRARQVLELIAAPMRPDGTWNRDREACRQMAAEALGRYED